MANIVTTDPALIGTNEFAKMVGADYSDISKWAKRGAIRVHCRSQRRGPGNTLLYRGDAEKIAAAVACGIPWPTAARLIDSLEVNPDGSALFWRRGA